MTVNLTCSQVSALLSFYIDDKLSSQLKQFVEAHLAICPTCAAKLEALKSMVVSLKEVHDKLAAIKPEREENASMSHYGNFKVNLSAYVDNELNDEENIKIKKYIISNPKARKELESMYNLKKAINNSFEKSKNEAKADYSKYVLKFADMEEEIYGPDSFTKVLALFVAILAVFTLTAVIVFWI